MCKITNILQYTFYKKISYFYNFLQKRTPNCLNLRDMNVFIVKTLAFFAFFYKFAARKEP